MTSEDLDSAVFRNYLGDLGVLVRELAIEAKQDVERKDSDFSAGYLAGFHRVVSLMQQQAEAFGIPLDEIGLDGIDADEDLV